MKTTLEQKQAINNKLTELNKEIVRLEDRILIWSELDMQVVHDLSIAKRELEMKFLDTLMESDKLGK